MAELINIINIYDFGRNIGGINPIVVNSSLFLSEKYNVYYCAAEEEPGFKWDQFEYIPLSNVCSEGYGEIKRAMKTIWNLESAKKFRRLLSRLDKESTVIHFHGWGMGLSASLIREASLSGFPLVYTAHDYSLVCPNGVYYDFQKEQDCRVRPLSLSCCLSSCDKKGRLVKLHRIFRKKIEAIFNPIECFDKVICVSKVVESVLVSCGVESSKITVVRNPYLLKPSYNDTIRIVDEFVFCYIGRMVEEKGVFDFCRAVSSVDGAKGVVIGSGELEQEVRRKFPAIEVTGWLKEPEMKDKLKSVNCVVLPSRWRETSALVVEDAFQNGIPVIVPSGTGAEEKVANGGGIVFTRGSIDELSRAMLIMMENYNYFIAGVDQAISDIETYDNYTTKLIDVYTSALENRTVICRDNR